MLKDITIGQYYPANSSIHKLDTTTKLVATVVFMISLFVVNKFWPYLLIAATMVAVIKMSNIPL
ncbi:MAG: energy-coupling factor transporter transmembrane protein EcfT, partial [Clostridium sp.]|nr:energy-coupling factor transporter transmembrane protein EcfT [Clostridium sp.]